jgi:hypothetical protein
MSGVRGSAVAWGTMLQAGRSRVQTEMSIRNILGGKARPARKADNLTAICEPIV